MYFPECRGDEIKKRDYLVKRLKDWERDFGNDYGCIEWKAVFISENTQEWRIYSSVFYAHSVDHTKEKEYSFFYPHSSDESFSQKYKFPTINVKLSRRYLDFSEMIKFIASTSIEEKTENKTDSSSSKMKVSIKDLSFFVNPIQNYSWNLESRLHSGLDWPFYKFNIRIKQPSVQTNIPFPLFAADNPYYTSHSFNYSFFNIPGIYPDKESIYLVLPIYKAKIDSLNLTGNILSYKITNKSENPLILKLILRYGRVSGKDHEIIIKREIESDEIELDREYDQIEVALSLKGSPFILQEESIGQHPVRLKDLAIPSNIEELREFTKVGEDQVREFKREYVKKDLLKEMIAFANTNDGIICIGVDDDGITYYGEEKMPKTIKTSLNDYVRRMCDPPDLEYEIMHFDYGDERYILLVIVPEGEDKPYYHLDYNRFYIRARGSSQPLDRKEFLKISEERRSG